VATFESRPDLIVSALTGPVGAEPGGSIAVRHTTQNRAGTGPSDTTTTRLHLSRNTAVGAGAPLLASVAVGALAPGQSSVTTSDVVVPPGTAAGIYFVVAQADALASQAETYETNNTRAVRLIVGADLAVTYLVAPTTAAPGAPILVTVVTVNALAVGPAPPSMTRVYLTRDAVLSPAEVVAERTVGRLAAGARDTWRPTITIPPSLAPGTYYLIARADDDGDVVELRETNNGRIRAIAIRP
jgi:subtilase family serine protease